MSEPGDFLSRWSRRKRAAAEGVTEPDRPAPAGEVRNGDGEAPPVAAVQQPQARPDARTDAQGPPPAAAEAEAEVDLGSLPPIESIGPDTDVRAFLRAGVPSALRHAALRRAWSSDPAIRDFKGLQENDWDFNDPDAIPGFGKLDPDFDVRRMVARVFGENESEGQPQPATVEQPALPSRQSDGEAGKDVAGTDAAENSRHPPANDQQELVQRKENIASQQEKTSQSSDQSKPRRHGGALPQVFPE